MKNITKILLFTFVAQFFFSCMDELDTINDISKSNFALINQDSIHANFPSLIKGKVGIVGYIFTNCPDICPLTTNNMRLIKEALENDKITNVEFVSISFDPEIDKPGILKNFSKLHNVQFSNWEFLTGEKETIKNLLKEVGVVAFVGDSVLMKDSSYTYLYVHTDRIQLIDQDGKIRKNYLGSKINIDEIVEDVKKLL